jgi:hypothetical protein
MVYFYCPSELYHTRKIEDRMAILEEKLNGVAGLRYKMLYGKCQIDELRYVADRRSMGYNHYSRQRE